MKQKLLMEKYPVFVLELPKAETDYLSVDEIVARLREHIEQHNAARFIADFRSLRAYDSPGG